MISMLLKLAVAALPLIAVCAASSHWLLADWATQAFLPKLGALLATVLIGLMVFVAGCALLRVAEIEELVHAVRRRLRRAG
jgi:uncharacterized membrane protein YcjF (UPF0283 family)